MKITIPKELNSENLAEQEQDCRNFLAQEKRFDIIINGKKKVAALDFANLKPEEKEKLKLSTTEIIDSLEIDLSKDIVVFVYYTGGSHNNSKVELRNFSNSQSGSLAGFGGVENYVKESLDKLEIKHQKEKQELTHKYAIDKLETKIEVLEKDLADAEEEIGNLQEKLEGVAPMKFISDNQGLIGAGLGLLKDYLPTAMGAGLGNIPQATLMPDDVLADFQGQEREMVMFFINNFKKDRNFLAYLHTHYTTQQTEQENEHATPKDSE